MALQINKFGTKVCLFYDDATGESGLACLETAGEALSKGNVVCYIIGGTSGKVTKCPTTGVSKSMPVGVCLTSVAGDNSLVWIAKTGLVQVLPESGITAVFGNVLVTSNAEAGTAKQYATVPAGDHWDEVGHWAVNGSGDGLITLASIHFN